MAASKQRGKKSRSSKSRGGRVSGNPATRAADERQRQLTTLFGTTAPHARRWWDASAAAVLTGASRLEQVDGPLALEDAACRLLGEELALRSEQEDSGFDLPGWLGAVTVHAVEQGGDPGDVPSRLLLHVIATSGPAPAAQRARARLTEIKRAPASAEFAARYPWAATMSPARPTGDALVAVDGYGSRYLVAAPFQFGGDAASAHWYAWDVDVCDVQRVVAAAVYTDPDAALAEWRAVVGPAVTEDSTLSPATEPALIRELLGDCLSQHVPGGSVMGDEDAGLLGEFFRMRSRANQLSRSMAGHSADPLAAARRRTAADTSSDDVLDEFGDWFSERHGVGEAPEELIGPLIVDWFESSPDFARYSCSPHRIRTVAAVTFDLYDAETASGILALLPDWVTWLSEKTGLAPALTERSLAAARRSGAHTRSYADFDEPEARIAE